MSTISYSLAPIPIWYFADNNGLPLAGGYMLTTHNLNPTVQFPVYQDVLGPDGIGAWTNPIYFDANGSQGPFYFQFDSANPKDTYFLQIFDADGNPIRTIKNYFPPQAGGGSGPITLAQTITNYIINGSFWRHVDNLSSPLPLAVVIAPGAHAGLNVELNYSDITFIKDSTANTDSINFLPFGQGIDSLDPDTTPEFYLEYVCTTSVSGETEKYLQFPICLHNKTLENQSMIFRFWARCNSGAATISGAFLPFYGTGGLPTATVQVPIAPFTLTSLWQPITFTAVSPTTAGITLGTCGDDSLNFVINLPLNLATSIDITNVRMYLGEEAPILDFQSYDQIDAVINTPRVGDFKISANNFQPYGWVGMNDGGIGNASSNGLARANIDTFPLFNFLWNNYSNAYCPLLNSSFDFISRGGSASSDFAANNQILLPRALGRVLAGAADPMTLSFVNDGPPYWSSAGDVFSLPIGAPVKITVNSGTLPSAFSTAVIYYYFPLETDFFGLSITPENALDMIPLTYGAGTGTFTLTSPAFESGQYYGELAGSLGASAQYPGVISTTMNDALNIIQPTTSMYFLMKL